MFPCISQFKNRDTVLTDVSHVLISIGHFDLNSPCTKTEKNINKACSVYQSINIFSAVNVIQFRQFDIGQDFFSMFRMFRFFGIYQ